MAALPNECVSQLEHTFSRGLALGEHGIRGRLMDLLFQKNESEMLIQQERAQHRSALHKKTYTLTQTHTHSHKDVRAYTHTHTLLPRRTSLLCSTLIATACFSFFPRVTVLTVIKKMPLTHL